MEQFAEQIHNELLKVFSTGRSFSPNLHLHESTRVVPEYKSYIQIDLLDADDYGDRLVLKVGLEIDYEQFATYDFTIRVGCNDSNALIGLECEFGFNFQDNMAQMLSIAANSIIDAQQKLAGSYSPNDNNRLCYEYIHSIPRKLKGAPAHQLSTHIGDVINMGLISSGVIGGLISVD